MSKKDEDASKEVGAAAPTALAIAEDFGADAGAGFEGTTSESFAIPFLAVLQKISPQCDEADAKFIKDAKGGQLFNSVNSRLYDGVKGVLWLAAACQRRFIRWGARGTPNSGFKAEMLPEVAMKLRDDGVVIEQDGKLFYPLPDGTINEKTCDRLSDTRNHFGILLDPETGNYGQVLISLTSSQIKKSKQLLSLLSEVKVKKADGSSVTPPTWYNLVRITTVPEKNDKGSWSGIKFDLEGFVTSMEIYNAAKAFHAAIAAGTAGPVVYNDPEEGTTDSTQF